MTTSAIGNPTGRVKIAAGLFWADYAALGAQVQDLEAGGADWIHIEVRDGVYMQFAMPRGGLDIIEATRQSTRLEIEAQLQMYRPNQEVFRQLADAGVNLISLPIETMGETTVENMMFIRELGLKVGVWAWEGTPLIFFEQLIPYADIIEFETWYPFWKPPQTGRSPHVVHANFEKYIRTLHDMIVAQGREQEVDLMMDGGLNVNNVSQFVRAGMTVGEFSSPLLKGPGGKLKPGTGEIPASVRHLRKALDEASTTYRTDAGLKS